MDELEIWIKAGKLAAAAHTGVQASRFPAVKPLSFENVKGRA